MSNDFGIIVGKEGFLLACYDVCISLQDMKTAQVFRAEAFQMGAGVAY